MNDKMYGSIGSEMMNRYFAVVMCFKRQPRWRRLQKINIIPDYCFSKPIYVYLVFHLYTFLVADKVAILLRTTY